MLLCGVKFIAYPTEKQKRVLSQWIGCVRFIYYAKYDENEYYCTFLRHSLASTGEKTPINQTYSQIKSKLTPWLDECPSQILRNSASRWYQAYQCQVAIYDL
jgi:putative transposase